METGHQIAPSTETYFRHSYESDHPDMARLYEQAKRDQWNASRDIAWDTPVPDHGRLIADDLVDIYGTTFWDALSERDRVELNRRTAAQPARRVPEVARPEGLPGDAGRRRGPPQRGARSLSDDAPRPALPDLGDDEGAVRHDPR
jgi:hypothetical protein